MTSDQPVPIHPGDIYEDCGVIKLSIADVIAARTDWSGYVARRKVEFEAEDDH